MFYPTLPTTLNDPGLLKQKELIRQAIGPLQSRGWMRNMRMHMLRVKRIEGVGVVVTQKFKNHSAGCVLHGRTLLPTPRLHHTTFLLGHCHRPVRGYILHQSMPHMPQACPSVLRFRTGVTENGRKPVVSWQLQPRHLILHR